MPLLILRWRHLHRHQCLSLMLLVLLLPLQPPRRRCVCCSPYAAATGLTTICFVTDGGFIGRNACTRLPEFAAVAAAAAATAAADSASASGAGAEAATTRTGNRCTRHPASLAAPSVGSHEGGQLMSAACLERTILTVCTRASRLQLLLQRTPSPTNYQGYCLPAPHRCLLFFSASQTRLKQEAFASFFRQR